MTRNWQVFDLVVKNIQYAEMYEPQDGRRQRLKFKLAKTETDNTAVLIDKVAHG